MQAAKAETCRMREEKKVVEGKCKVVEQERDQLKKELEDLRAAFEAKKKQHEEIRVGFTVKKEALTEDYQKQVEKMFFYCYQCCMMKNGIT